MHIGTHMHMLTGMHTHIHLFARIQMHIRMHTLNMNGARTHA